MARKAILETSYTFTPASKTLVIPRYIPRERLIIITNVTTNTVIYNFSDPNLSAVAYVPVATVNNPSTTIVFNYDTAAMSANDKIQIIVDEYEEKFTPSEPYIDPVNKLRISQPQALIDTDFEYGTQITKWENLAVINNRPFAFPSATGIGTIVHMTFPTGSKIVTVGVQGTAPSVGTPIYVQDSYLTPANGNYIVETVLGAGNTQFTYTARAVNSSTIISILDQNKTGIFSGTIYTNAQIGSAPSSYQVSSAGIVTITTTVPHGLAIGNEVAIRNVTGTNPPNGSFAVVSVPSNTSFAIAHQPVPAGLGAGEIYVRPQGNVLHRPFDGGVIFSSNANANFETTIRQTRRYFRYQSGKGLQVSSGTILRPNLQVDSMTASGSTITVITKEQHNIQPGTVVQISGVTPENSPYNGSFTINTITGYNTFQYTAGSAPSETTASGFPYVTVTNWYGATNRLGIFDEQNGLYFEYDGQQIYAVRRNSTFQLSGKVSVTQGSSTVSQSNASFPTYFSKQLLIGDFIVLRGQSYRVLDINNDTTLTITPAYRGSSADFVIVSKTTNIRVPQSQWNIDKCDGNGPSGFNLDLGRMQMYYIDYSWYGAGFIRYGFRGPDGNILYCHKIANNNVNTEAYMRSGNLPARYETSAIPPTTQINRSILTTDTFVGIASTAGFPPSGTLLIRDSSSYEYVNYTGIGSTAFLGVTRAKTGGAVSGTVSANSNAITGITTTNLQVGMRAIHPNLPDGTWISALGASSATLCQASTAAISAGIITFSPMGSRTPLNFTFAQNNPAGVELAFPTFGPTISHWGTSVIMDGRFDDDKSLIFTFGQTTTTTIQNGQSRALFSIRVAPSVDNGISGAFGTRDLINRMQLTLDSIGISIRGSSGNLLITAVLNGVPSTATTWTNAVGNAPNAINSSLAQIANYAGGSTTISGGETIAGFYVNSTDRLDLTGLRDLGNSILGGGGANSNTQMYPDGPDVLTFVVTNLATQGDVPVLGRLSWTEAQA